MGSAFVFRSCFALSVLSLLTSCSTDVWLLSVDSQNRPIVGCFSVDLDAYKAAALSMDCRRSNAVETIDVCSNDRLLFRFSAESECEETRLEFTRANGEFPGY